MDHEVYVWIPIIAIGGSFAMVVAIVWLITRTKQRGAQYRAEVQMKVIERFGTAGEFTQFLESPAGREFLEQPRRMTRDRVLGGFTSALVCTFIGLAFLGSAFATGDPGFYIPAFILMGIGIALFISSAISWKLTKQWTGTRQPPGGLPTS